MYVYNAEANLQGTIYQHIIKKSNVHLIMFWTINLQDH